MAVHVAFAALVGAGFGAARKPPARKDRLTVVGAGAIAAVGGHFVTDATMPGPARWTENVFSTWWVSSRWAAGVPRRDPVCPMPCLEALGNHGLKGS
jgi:hypothetical protein